VKLSVIIPSYNSMPYVTEAVESVLSQLQPGDEIVVQDGASTDGTLGVMQAFASRDERVKVESQTDSGQSEALNRALSRAVGDYVLWLNADDVVSDGAIHKARAEIRPIDTEMPDLVVGGHRTLDQSGNVIATYRGRPLQHSRLMSLGCYVFSGSMLIEKTLLVRAGGFQDKFNYSMDLDLMLRLVSLRPSQAVIEEPIGALRWHDASKSGSVGSRFATEAWRVRRLHSTGLPDLARSVAAFVRQSIALSTIPLRHSRFYSKLRGSLR